MGLTVIQAEIASKMGYKTPDELQLYLENCGENQSQEKGTPLEWFQLAHEVHDSALAATNGKFRIDFLLVPQRRSRFWVNSAVTHLFRKFYSHYI